MKNIGTVIVSRDAVKKVCKEAIRKLDIIDSEIEVLKLIQWRRYFNNRKSILDRLLKRKPERLYSLQSVREKINRIRDKNDWTSTNYPYTYNHEWRVRDSAEQLLRCCNSDILEPLTIDIDAWDDIVYVSNYSDAKIKKIIENNSSIK